MIDEAMELLKTGDHPVRTEGRSQELHLEPWELSARKNLFILEALMSLEEENATSVERNGSEQPVSQKIKGVLQSLQDTNHGNENGAPNPSPTTLSRSDSPATASLTHSKEPQDYGVLPVLSSGDADDDIWQFLHFDFPPSCHNPNSENVQL
ncbi:MAG: hypothetical protein Q9198_007598 [Flavoplaca austrocitrina]